jgi:hypothetical protein
MNEEVFFQLIRRSPFGGKLSQAQVDGMKGLLTAFDQVGDGDLDTLAYGFATTFHETGRRMEPVREGNVKTDASARKAVARLAAKRGPKSAVAKYAQPTGPWGHVYYGRGYPQLTFMQNYAACSKDAGVNLVKNPDAMLDPVISARVLFRGIIDGRWNGQGKGIAFYEGDDDFLDDKEAAAARRTVNVQDKAVLIAGYHRAFFNALTAAGWKPSAATTEPPAAAPHSASRAAAGEGSRTPPAVQRTPVPAGAGVVAAVIAASAAAWQWGRETLAWMINLF